MALAVLAMAGHSPYTCISDAGGSGLAFFVVAYVSKCMFCLSGEGWVLQLSTRIKDAGIAIRHSRGRILFYTAGSRNGLEGLGGKGTLLKKS